MDQFFFPNHGNPGKSRKKHASSSSRNKKTKAAKDKDAKRATPSESSFLFIPRPPQAADYWTEGDEDDAYEKNNASPRRRPSIPTTNARPMQSQPPPPAPPRRAHVPFLDFWNSVRLLGPHMQVRSPADPPPVPADQGHQAAAATQQQQQQQQQQQPPPESTAVHFAVHDYTAACAQAPTGVKFVVGCALGDMHRVADLVAPGGAGRRLVVRGLSGRARAGSDLAALVRDGLTSLSLEIFEDF